VEEIRIGISTCLLGEQVRYDGGHKHDRYVTDVLGRYFRFVAVCPEVEVGMGVPREPVRLVRCRDDIRMVGVRSATDHTASMRRHAARRVEQLRGLDLSGYILKKGSPSCGLERVRTYTAMGMPAPASRGLFAHALVEAMPLLPVEEEGRLCDERLRESFVERVFAYRRLCGTFSPRWKIADLVALHTREKMLIASHAPSAEKELGRLVAAARQVERAELQRRYCGLFMRALARPATRARHVNVLQHMLGHFRRRLDAPTRAAIADVIERYRTGAAPLVAPITLLRHYAVLCGVGYLTEQTYLEPHPAELMLRNHV